MPTPIQLIRVGTANRAKIMAVKATVLRYEQLRDATIYPIGVASSVSEQPITMEETIRGSIARAAKAANDITDWHGVLSIGIESGLMQVPHSRTGYMDFCSVAVFSGDFPAYLGLSPAFECPQRVIDLVLSEHLNLNDAFLKAGLTEDRAIGASGGAISLLTKGRMTRSQYTEAALIMALSGWENS